MAEGRIRENSYYYTKNGFDREDSLSSYNSRPQSSLRLPPSRLGKEVSKIGERRQLDICIFC